MTKLNPIQADNMPREVATAILTEPKARITNTFRKVCKRAREVLYLSATPIRAAKSEDGTTNYFSRPADAPKSGPPAQLRKATFGQLTKWLRRNVQRRHNCQVDYQLLGEVTGGTPKQQAARRRDLAILELQVKLLDEARENLEDEVMRRAKAQDVVANANPFGFLVQG